MSLPFELLAFAGVLALGQFSPGPDMLLLTRTALKEGARAGVAMASGIAIGLTIHATVAIAGMAVVFEQSGWLRSGMRWMAAGYLMWLAHRFLKEWFVGVRPGAQERESAPITRRGAFVQGLLCNLLNPKVVIFLAALVAPFLTGDRPLWWPWALWTIIVVEGMTLWALWAMILQIRAIREVYRRAAPWMTLGFGLVLLCLAGSLLLG